MVGVDARVESVLAAPDGAWSLLCQERREVLHVRGAGNEQVTGALLADPQRGVLVVGRRGRLVLLRPDSPAVDLGPFRPLARFLHPFAAALDRSGNRLVYPDLSTSEPRVVLRDLRTGAERTISHGDGRLVGIRSIRGSWIEVDVGVGLQREPPADFYRPLRGWICDRQPGYCERDFSGPTTAPTFIAVQRLLHWPTGTVMAAERRVPFGDAFLTERNDGAFVRHDGAGVDTVLLPSSCGASLVAVVQDPPRAVVACTGEPRCNTDHARTCRLQSMEILTPAGRRALSVEADTIQLIHRLVDGRLVLRLGDANGPKLVVLDEDASHATAFNSERPLAFHDNRALVASADGTLEVIELLSGRSTTIPGRFDGSRVLRAGPLAATSGLVIDIKRGTVSGRYRGTPKALSIQGELLLGTNTSNARLGPLMWRSSHTK